MGAIVETETGGTVKEMDGNRLQRSLADLLGRFGVEESATIDAVLATARKVVSARGHVGEVVGLRHGELRIEAVGTGAKMLHWDGDQILAALEKEHPGVVHKINIQRPRQTRTH